MALKYLKLCSRTKHPNRHCAFGMSSIENTSPQNVRASSTFAELEFVSEAGLCWKNVGKIPTCWKKLEKVGKIPTFSNIGNGIGKVETVLGTDRLLR